MVAGSGLKKQRGDRHQSGQTHTRGGPWWGSEGKEMLSDRTGSGRNDSVPSHGSQGTAKKPLSVLLCQLPYDLA